LPFTTLLLWVGMMALPRDILAAAEIDGGRGLRVLTRVYLPLAWPVVAVVGLWVFLSSWSEFALPNQLLTTSPIQTAPMALDSLAGTHDTQFNLLGAGTIVMIVPVVLGLALVYGPAARWTRSASRTLAVRR
jgi:ABC-type glycerol-3-phosphate transport system permease component